MVKNNVKRFGAIAIVLVMLFSLAACTWWRSDGISDYEITISSTSISLDATFVNHPGESAEVTKKVGPFYTLGSVVNYNEDRVIYEGPSEYFILELGVVAIVICLSGCNTFAGTYDHLGSMPSNEILPYNG